MNCVQLDRYTWRFGEAKILLGLQQDDITQFSLLDMKFTPVAWMLANWVGILYFLDQ